MEKYPLLNLRDVLNLLNLEKPSQFWWEKDCRITNEGFFPKRLTADDMNILTVLEFDALDTMLNGLELKLPTTPAEVVDWAERCGFADVLPDDFVAAHKQSEAMGSDEELKNGFNYGLTGSIIRHLAGDGVFNVDWQYWLDLPKWTPEQAVCLLYGIDSDVLDNHECRNLLVKLTRKAEFRGNMTPYQWQQFGIEQKLLPPKQILLIEPQQAEATENGGVYNQANTELASVNDGKIKQRTRKTNLSRAINSAIQAFDKKPSLDELWQFFQDNKDETGFIHDYTDIHITWIDTKGKFHDTQKETIANHLSQIKS